MDVIHNFFIESHYIQEDYNTLHFWTNQTYHKHISRNHLTTNKPCLMKFENIQKTRKLYMYIQFRSGFRIWNPENLRPNFFFNGIPFTKQALYFGLHYVNLIQFSHQIFLQKQPGELIDQPYDRILPNTARPLYFGVPIDNRTQCMRYHLVKNFGHAGHVSDISPEKGTIFICFVILW